METSEMNKLIFKKLIEFKRYSKISSEDFDHSEYCNEKIKFVETSGSLTDKEFNFLEKIREIWGKKEEITPKFYTGYCMCGEYVLKERKSIEVKTIDYGREFVINLKFE
jgi:hypothetical protein